jgi:formylglycine-generating enzyme required for sulfatase activity
MNRSQPNGRFSSRREAERIALLLVLATGGNVSAHQPAISEPPKAPAPTAPEPKLVAFAQEVPVAAYKIDMLPIPGSADGKIKPFYMSKTELGWEAFDVYIYRLDEEAGKGPMGKSADAISRPTKPYLPPDRGFGHEGYAAISMSYKNASEFCKWLSAQTGRTYRLPTEAEWELAARATAPADKATGNTVPDGSKLDDCAWYEPNSGDSPHPVGKKKPNALGLCDMLGNVAEWVTSADGKPVTKGGCYQDAPEKLTVAARTPADASWNSSDPQIPKSKWWLSDGPFVGFRIVCETAAPTKPAERAEKPPAPPSPSTSTPATPATPATNAAPAQPEKKP